MRKLEQFLFFVTAVDIILIVGLRHESLGTDTVNYLYLFQNPFDVNGYYDINTVEPVYAFVTLLIRFFTDNKYIYSFIITTMSLTPIMYLIKRYSDHKMLSVFLFISFSVGMSLFFLSYSMLRQFLAIGFFCILLNGYIENHCKWNRNLYVIAVIMILCHYSSAMCIVLFIIDKINITKKLQFYIMLASAFAGYMLSVFFPWLMFIAESIDKGFYLTNLGDSYSNNVVSKIPYLAIFFMFLWNLSEQECNNIWIKGLFLAIVMGNFFNFGNNADRMCAYFYAVSIITIPNAMNRINNSTIKCVMLLSIILYFSYKYYVIFDIVKGSLYILAPYKSCI